MSNYTSKEQLKHFNDVPIKNYRVEDNSDQGSSHDFSPLIAVEAMQMNNLDPAFAWIQNNLGSLI